MASSKFQSSPRLAQSNASVPIATSTSNTSTTSALPIKTAHHQRPPHNHASHSFGSSTHRVTRRKSMSSSSVSQAAVIAAMKEAEASASPIPVVFTLPKENITKTTSGFVIEDVPSTSGTGYPSPPSSLPNTSSISSLSNGFRKTGFASNLTGTVSEDTIEEEEGDSSRLGVIDLSKGRNRRASEGASDAGNSKNDLKCEKCGKGYKHSSCLTKHLWEHTPEWNLTSKLSISKHQQVQLLEAASILVSMKPNSPPTSAESSSSPPNMNDSSNESSSEATPPPSSTPPPSENRLKAAPSSGAQSSKRFSNSARSANEPYSRSYQPPPSGYFSAGKSVPKTIGSKHVLGSPPVTLQHGISATLSPSIAQVGSPNTRHDDESLAAAVELLSCSFRGTPKLGPLEAGMASPHLSTLAGSTSTKLPQVPENDNVLDSATPTKQISGLTTSLLSQREDKDVEMNGVEEAEKKPPVYNLRSFNANRYRDSEMVIDDEEDEEDDDHYASSSKTEKTQTSDRSQKKNHEDYEEGVFGNMEE